MTIRPPGLPLPARTWRVVTTAGTFRLEAVQAATAILSGLELAGPGAQLVACLREGEW